MFRSIMVRVGTVVVAAAGAAAAMASPASAEPVGVLAQYEGRTIDLGQGWADAQVCAEFAVGDVRCYRTVEELPAAGGGEFGVAAATDCPSGWVCLWEDINHQGRRLQWSAAGTKKLAEWDFRDKASSGAVRRIQNGVTLVNYRSLLPDATVPLRAGGIYSDFREFDWNDITDEIRM